MTRSRLILAIGLVARAALAQEKAGVTLSLADAAVARLRGAYFGMDYEGGAAEADRLVKQFPKVRELAAWRVANLARSDHPLEARRAADSLLAANRNDPWGWFARSLVLEYAGEGGGSPAEVLAASADAIKRAPKNSDVIWLRALILNSESQSGQALALIDSALAAGRGTQQLKTLRANVLFELANVNRKRDDAKVEAAMTAYEESRKADPADVSAYIFPASRLLNVGRTAEAYDLAKQGAAMAPRALAVHELYWRAIDGRKDRPQAQRDTEALADVEALLKERGDVPNVLLRAASQYRSRKDSAKAAMLEERILRDHPASVSAEWVYVQRYRAIDAKLNESKGADTSLRPAYRVALWSFLDRQTHVRDRLIGDAYRQLFFLSDSTTNADTLLRIVRGMVKYEGINPHIVYADGAIRLAERGRDFAEAEKIAREGLKAGKARIDEQKAMYETVGDYAHGLDFMSAFMYDALGVVAMRRGNLDEAQRHLAHARELDPKNTKALVHLGELAERQHRLDAAEQFYIKGSLLSTISTNPNRAALQRLYEARRGSSEGYDEYMAGLLERDRANRRREIAESRAKSPAVLKSFSLRTLDGKVITLASLRGRVAVINNWGMWCGPCVAELPEFQKFTEQHATDSSVAVLTIDNDPNTDALREWLAKKGYTFSTLLDDGYLARSGVHTYPTTWFLDREGRIAFTKVGWSEKLVEEFGWRVEAIRGGEGRP